MRAEFDIIMTDKAMRNYRFYHKYTQFSGIIEIMLGVFLLAFAFMTYGETQISYTLIVGFMGVFFLVIMPVSMAMRCTKTVKTNKKFKAPTHYVITEDKMVLSIGDLSQEVFWDMIYRVKETKVNILVYFSPVSANILPKDQLGEQESVVRDIFRKKIDPYKVRLALKDRN